MQREVETKGFSVRPCLPVRRGDGVQDYPGAHSVGSASIGRVYHTTYYQHMLALILKGLLDSGPRRVPTLPQVGVQASSSVQAAQVEDHRGPAAGGSVGGWVGRWVGQRWGSGDRNRTAERTPAGPNVAFPPKPPAPNPNCLPRMLHDPQIFPKRECNLHTGAEYPLTIVATGVYSIATERR